MRVLHISSPKTWRGGEQQLMYLVEELNKVGVWQMVMCPFNSSVHKYCLKNHINHVTYFKGFSANPMVAFRVSHICKREKLDLIHVHDSHAHNFAVLSTVLSNNNLPIVVSRRVDFPIQGGPMSMFKYNHSRISKILCVSAAIRDIMLPSIVDKSKLEVVYSGVDLEKFENREEPPSLREELGISEDTLLVGNVAALAPHKDYPTFVRTAKRIIDSGAKVRFLAIGDGPSRKLVEQCIAELGMEEHVLLLGFRKDIIDILPQLDVFLITSETEGLGTSILDAQVAGVPVLATKAGGIVEIVQHDQNGLSADVADDEALARELMRYINDPALRKSMADAAKKSVIKFSKSETAKRTKEVYESILKTKS
jgi:glycosyltransferase involved in cell wall biosynthesis